MSNLLTVPQVAEKLNMSAKTVYKWVANKKITFIKLPGGDIRFDEAAINGWLERKTIKAKKHIA